MGIVFCFSPYPRSLNILDKWKDRYACIELLFGFFNYGKRGILDKTHKRLFTFSTLKSLLVQNDFKITKSYGIPAPFPLAVGENFLSKILININTFLIKISKNLYSQQQISINHYKEQPCLY